MFTGCEVPGKIKIFPRGEDGHGSVVTFKSGLDCDSMQTPPSTDLRGPRNTLLGTNVYVNLSTGIKESCHCFLTYSTDLLLTNKT